MNEDDFEPPSVPYADEPWYDAVDVEEPDD